MHVVKAFLQHKTLVYVYLLFELDSGFLDDGGDAHRPGQRLNFLALPVSLWFCQTRLLSHGFCRFQFAIPGSGFALLFSRPLS